MNAIALDFYMLMERVDEIERLAGAGAAEEVERLKRDLRGLHRATQDKRLVDPLVPLVAQNAWGLRDVARAAINSLEALDHDEAGSVLADIAELAQVKLSELRRDAGQDCGPKAA